MRVICWLAVLGCGVSAVSPAAYAAPRASAQQLAQIPPSDPAAAGAVVDQIVVEGAQRIEPDTIRSYLTVKPGDSVTAETVDGSMKALFATGLFADVAIGRSGAALVVRVVENPVINRMVFEGNQRLDSDVLQNEVQLRPRVVFTRTKVQNDVKRLLEVYRRSGRFAATVEPKVIELPQNRIDLVFEINEGDLTGVSRVSFIGNKRFSDGALRGEIQTKETRWYRFLSVDDSYDPDRVAFDREMLRRFYLRNGYADFRVLSAVAELAPDQKSFYLAFTLEEGERYKYGKVDVKTTLKDLNPADVAVDIKQKQGDWYNAESIEETVRLLTNRVGSLGYAFVEIEPVLNRNRDDRVIDVTFDIREGPKVYVERIDVVGNQRTLDRVVRREFRLVEGDAFNTERLRRSERAMKDLGFFRNVEVKTQPGSQPDRTIITAKVEEQSTGELTIGGGYSSVDGALAELSIRERNLLGRGQDLRLTTMIAQRRQEFDISFTEPYFLDRNVSLTVDGFKITRDWKKTSSYDWKTSGGAVGLGYQLNENLRHQVRYTLRADEVSNVQEGASRYIRDQMGERIASIVGHDLTYDRRDSRIEPTEGYLLALGNDVAGLIGDASFFRTRAKGQYYYPFTPEWVLALRSEAGYIAAIEDDGIRINDRFFLGGDNLRGFSRGGAGPRDVVSGDALGAKWYYALTTELQVPLGLPKELGLMGRIFHDMGASGGLDEAGPEVRDTGSLRASAGVGLSWRSPFGPIRIDFGFPYLKESFDKTETVRFSFGTRF